MHMRQLNYVATRKLEWFDVPRPWLDADDSALVCPYAVSTCDFDAAVIRGDARLRGPVPLGHEGVAIVKEVGDHVARVRPGDHVIVPWKISCGTCIACERGFTAQCERIAPEDAYGWGPTAELRGGFLSDTVLVPFADHMLRPLPPGVDPLAACGVADNISDAWRAVGPQLSARPGGTVLIAGKFGAGSIGLYAAGIAVALGAGRVVYADSDADRLQIAATLGAETFAVEGNALNVPADALYDVTVEAAGDPTYLTALLERTGRAGACTSIAGMLYRTAPVPFPIHDMYRRSIEFRTGWAHTRAIMDEPLELIASGRFDPRPVTTAVVSWDDAATALTEPYIKLIVSRDPG